MGKGRVKRTCAKLLSSFCIGYSNPQTETAISKLFSLNPCPAPHKKKRYKSDLVIPCLLVKRTEEGGKGGATREREGKRNVPLVACQKYPTANPLSRSRGLDTRR